MPGTGIEPARPNGHMALNHACLPVPASGQTLTNQHFKSGANVGLIQIVAK